MGFVGHNVEAHADEYRGLLTKNMERMMVGHIYRLVWSATGSNGPQYNPAVITGIFKAHLDGGIVQWWARVKWFINRKEITPLLPAAKKKLKRKASVAAPELIVPYVNTQEDLGSDEIFYLDVNWGADVIIESALVRLGFLPLVQPSGQFWGRGQARPHAVASLRLHTHACCLHTCGCN